LLAFLDFYVIVTGGGLLFDLVPQALGQGANDNNAQLVGGPWGLWCLTLSDLSGIRVDLVSAGGIGELPVWGDGAGAQDVGLQHGSGRVW
jgi:hypothetical protein